MFDAPGWADVIVIGAGAAGVATAIFTCRDAPALRVRVLEGAARPGAKILVSGGSRCNVTNHSVTERDFNGGNPALVRRVLRGFTVAETIDFFARAGVPLHEEADGKLFPDSNRSRDVLDALLREVARGGAVLSPSSRVIDVSRAPDGSDGFVVRTARDVLRARVVVLATGGLALPKSGSDGAGLAMVARLGHSLVPTTPALVPLVLDAGESSLHRDVQGVSHDAELMLTVGGRVVRRVAGALLWTHFGMSGPAVLDMSRHWLRAALDGATPRLSLSFHPGETFESVDAAIMTLAHERPRLSLAAALSLRLPASVAHALAGYLKIPHDLPLARLERADRRRLVHALTNWPLPVTGSRGYTFAEVTAGGVPLDEIDCATMQSRRCRGLFLVGELLDVDGRLGGFNFQWAWASARVAARGIARTALADDLRAEKSGERPA